MEPEGAAPKLQKFIKDAKALDILNLIDLASDGIFISDLEHKFVHVNQRACQMTGYSYDQLTRMKITDLAQTPQINRGKFEQDQKDLIAGKTILVEDVFTRADKSTITVEISSKLMPNGYVQAFARDISERKLLENKLQRSESEFRVLAEAIPHIVFSVDALGNPLFVNSAWTEYTRLNGMKQEDWFSVIHPEDVPDLKLYWQKTIKEGKNFEHEYRIRKFDGTYRWFLGRAKALRDKDGFIERWVGAASDIHDQKIAVHVQENQRKWLERILNTIPTAISLVDPNTGTTLYANEAARALAGPRAQNGILPDALVMRDSTGKLLAKNELPHARLARGEQVKGMELKWESDGNKLILSVFGEILPALYGFDATCVLSIQDITKLKSIELELKRSNQDLELFASAASHDLQEPLRTISNFVELLANGLKDRLQGEEEEIIRFIRDGAIRMKALIADLLEFAHVGKQSKEWQTVDCNSILKKALLNLKVAIEEKNAQIHSAPLPTIDGSESQLIRLFQNLIANGLKYNQSARPQITIQCQEKNEEWLFSIKDNGIGIAEESQEKIFEPFQRLHGRSEYSGTGLGLPVCKRIIEAHGGNIWVESIPNKGSTFYFTLLGKKQ